MDDVRASGTKKHTDEIDKAFIDDCYCRLLAGYDVSNRLLPGGHMQGLRLELSGFHCCE